MRRPIRTLFYGLTHEHAEGKFATLKRMPETFEIVGVVDDRPRGSTFYVDTQLEPSGCRVLSEEEAFSVPDIEAVFVEADMNYDYGKAGYADYIASFPGGVRKGSAGSSDPSYDVQWMKGRR